MQTEARKMVTVQGIGAIGQSRAHQTYVTCSPSRRPQHYFFKNVLQEADHLAAHATRFDP
jgi:hypothetical protein